MLLLKKTQKTSKHDIALGQQRDEAAQRTRISNLFKGEISRFSIDKLINLLARAGREVHIETKRKAA